MGVLKDAFVQVEKFFGKETVLMNQNVEVFKQFLVTYISTHYIIMSF